MSNLYFNVTTIQNKGKFCGADSNEGRSLNTGNMNIHIKYLL